MEQFLSYNLINSIPGIESKSYLELGVADGINFNKVNTLDKISVDINGKAIVNNTTDNFFAGLDTDKKFDIIYIDANHDFDFLVRDFNNSVNHCNKFIIIHDLIPPTAEHAKNCYCSDSYKVLYFLLKEKNFVLYTLKHPSFMGMTIIKMPATELSIPESYREVSYEQFIDFINSYHVRYELEELISILNK